MLILRGKCGCVLLFVRVVIFGSILLPSVTWAYTLRLWVMPNEVLVTPQPIDETSVKQFIKNAADRNVIIENGGKDLDVTSEPDWMNKFGYKVAEQRVLIDLLGEYISHNPDIDKIYVEFLRWTDAYYRISSLSSGSYSAHQPDIIQIGSTWTASFADKKIIAPIDSSLVQEKFFPPTVASCKIEGGNTVYAIPWFIDVRLIYYWKKYFPTGSEAFSSFENFSKSLRNIEGATPFVASSVLSWNLLHNLAPWIWGSGGKLVKSPVIPGLYLAPWDDSSFREAVTYLHSLASSDLLVFSKKTYEEIDEEFFKERHASILSTSSIIRRLNSELAEQIGMAIPPGKNSQGYAFVGGSHLAITKFSKDRGEYNKSLELVKFITSPDSELKYAISSAFLPASKQALDDYLSRNSQFSIFKKALETGKSYPSIPEWGEIFENDVTRNHLANLYNDLSLGNDETTVFATLSGISKYLNKRLRQKTISHYIYPIVLIMFSSLVALIVVIKIWRRKQSILIEKIRSVNAKFARMTSEIMHHNRKTIIPKINADGGVFVGDTEIKFDNARQARLMIEYIARNTNISPVILHFMRGFVLFNWDVPETKLSPNRLFHVAVSKLNAPLKKQGLEPILVSAGRGSSAWKIVWDNKTLTCNNNICLAVSHVEQAIKLWNENNMEESVKEIISALKLDFKSIEAYTFLKERDWKNLPISKSDCDFIQKISEKSYREFTVILERQEQGLLSAKNYIESEKRRDEENGKLLKAEFEKMKIEISQQKNIIQSIFGDSVKDSQPAHLSEIVKYLKKVSDELDALSARGMSNTEVWSNIADGKNFNTLVSIPSVRDLVHNYYCYDTKQKEDYRLVQLAMMCMLENKNHISHLECESNSEEFIKKLRRGIAKEFEKLELTVE